MRIFQKLSLLQLFWTATPHTGARVPTPHPQTPLLRVAGYACSHRPTQFLHVDFSFGVTPACAQGLLLALRSVVTPGKFGGSCGMPGILWVAGDPTQAGCMQVKTPYLSGPFSFLCLLSFFAKVLCAWLCSNRETWSHTEPTGAEFGLFLFYAQCLVPPTPHAFSLLSVLGCDLEGCTTAGCHLQAWGRV